MFKEIIDYFTSIGVNPSATVSIIVTSTIFCLGFIINWIVAGLSKWRKRKNYRKNLKIIINNFLKSCEKQYLAFDEFPLQPGFLDGYNYTIKLAPNFSLRYLTNLDINVFIENFSSLLKKSRAEEISNIMEDIEKIRSNKELLEQQITFTYSNYVTHLGIYNENIDNIRKLQDDIVLKYHNGQISPILYEYILAITNVFKDWQDNGAAYFIKSTLTEIVNPIFGISKQSPPNEFSRDFIDYAIKCRAAAENIENLEQLLRDTILDSKTVNRTVFENGTGILSRW